MDQIEKYFKSNKQDMDTLQVEDGTWEEIEARLSPLPPKPKRNLFLYTLVAASVALIIGFGLGLNTEPDASEGQIATIHQLEVGMQFPDLTLRTPKGDKVPLASLNGKIVLVEFWASYSKVCTEQHCFHFQPIYEEYRDQGFEIYGISVDSSAVDWLHAIEQDDLSWINVASLGGPPGMNANFTENDLPATYLLDKSGMITAKDIDVSELRLIIENQLASN